MNFAQEMIGQHPEQVRAYIVGRLRDGRGPTWNESQGEPRWGLLLSAFHYWRSREAQLQAVDDGLNKLLPELFADDAWPAAEAACSYVLALGNLETPWHPGQMDSWPFTDWLRQPRHAASDAHLNAMGAALRLMRQRKLVNESWARENFRQVAAKVSGLAGSPRAVYLLDSWKAWAEAARPTAGGASPAMWFELLRQADGLGASSLGATVLALAMDWALGRCAARERSGVVAELMTAIGHLPPTEQGASMNGAPHVAARQAAEDVVGDAPGFAAAKQSGRLVGHGTRTLRDPEAVTYRVSQPCLQVA